MIEKKDLFTLMFYALDDAYDKNKNTELGNYLSSANPFLFEDFNSADPFIFKDFCNSAEAIDESDYGYAYVLHYLEKIKDGKLLKFFLSKTKSEWEEAFQAYKSNR